MRRQPPKRKPKEKRMFSLQIDKGKYIETLKKIVKAGANGIGYAPIFVILERLFTPSERKRRNVLEIGYGTPDEFLPALKHLGFQKVFGCDICKRPDKVPSGIRILTSEATQISKHLKKESIDVILARGVFEIYGWKGEGAPYFPEDVEGIKKIFSKVFSILKPGGILILAPLSYEAYSENMKKALSHFGKVFSYYIEIKSTDAFHREEILIVRKYKKPTKS
ncbi:MAG: hypothetical protein DRO04_00800 [Candidatus Iainarchaeum archaeon]|uniref:Methyltransferase type 11 domain-containing protein n=1 Tax=Candidatus Iainarchaeum sp. TaxID=3101447 RepID=A0A497JL44_9ARCH|nr:MAG: hypothetical protein DRO04_00800 [Candidatus Diapherotrites archaeon]